MKHDWWDAEPMRQEAPYPQALADLVDSLSYRDGWPGQSWRFTLQHVDRGQGSAGLTLCIRVEMPDTYHPEQMRPVMHYMIVPAAAYDERSWRRWLFEQIGLVGAARASVAADHPEHLVTVEPAPDWPEDGT